MNTNHIINCTPHPVHIYDQSGETVLFTFPRSEYVPRLEQQPQKQTGSIITADGKEVPVYSPQQFDDVSGLPPCQDEQCPDIIVSMLVGQKLMESGAWRGAVYGPDTGKGAVRADSGQIVGTTRLVEYCARNTLSQ